jgi:HNH endonuclease
LSFLLISTRTRQALEEGYEKGGFMNWTTINGIKIDDEDFSALLRDNLEVWMDQKEYPIYGFFACSICAAQTCLHQRTLVRMGYLHDWIWDRAHPERPKRRGEIIHHKDHHPSNARRKNLGIGDRRAHALTHTAKKQKFSPRKKQNLFRWYRPPQPARVIDRPDILALGMKEEPPKKKEKILSRQQQLRLLERRLEELLPPLEEEMKDRDSGIPIPRSASTREWRNPQTRRLGIRTPRLGCTEAEVALVFLLIKSAYSIEAVSESIYANAGLLQEIRSRPSVDRALTNWRSYGRLPKPKRLAYTRTSEDRAEVTPSPRTLTSAGSPARAGHDPLTGSANSCQDPSAASSTPSPRIGGLELSQTAASSSTARLLTPLVSAGNISLSHSVALEIQTAFTQLEDEAHSIERLPPAWFLDSSAQPRGSPMAKLLIRKLRHAAAKHNTNVTELLAASARRLGRDAMTLSSVPRARFIR